MFSAGIGLVHNSIYLKDKAEMGLLIVKLGGPAYRIGIGGGSASSRSGGTVIVIYQPFNVVMLRWKIV